MSGIITCLDCGGPWGVVLPRGHTDVDVLRSERMLHTDGVPLGLVATSSAVFVSTPDASWLTDGGFSAPKHADTWVDVDDLQAPAWWINQRRRFVVRSMCCAVVAQ